MMTTDTNAVYWELGLWLSSSNEKFARNTVYTICLG